MTQQDMIDKFSAWIDQRPRLDWRNYGSRPQDINIMKAEYKHIAQQKKRALKALAIASHLPYIQEAWDNAFRAFSGRLELNESGEFEYTAGQYWPTEYRLAAAVVLEAYVWECAYYTIESARIVVNWFNKQYTHNWIENWEKYAQEQAQIFASTERETDLDKWLSRRNKILDRLEKDTNHDESFFAGVNGMIKHYERLIKAGQQE